MNKKQAGFSVAELLIIIVILGVIGFVGFKVLAGDKKKDDVRPKSAQSQASQSASVSEGLIWQQTEDGWQANRTAPSCPSQPMLKAPADLTKVTAVLYPGQTRGGNYKPHGGFRFDTVNDNKVTVMAPMDGYIVKGSRYLADGVNEVQYSFDIMNNCGVMYRVGHLRELPVNLQKIVDAFPAATTSSAMQNVDPTLSVKQGEILATKVGIITDKNTFFDWGVYDYRQENDASKTASYQSAHPQKELAWHATCWLKDWLPANDETKLNSLPAGDPTSGKSSDYCK